MMGFAANITQTMVRQMLFLPSWFEENLISSFCRIPSFCATSIPQRLGGFSFGSGFFVSPQNAFTKIQVEGDYRKSGPHEIFWNKSSIYTMIIWSLQCEPPTSYK